MSKEEIKNMEALINGYEAEEEMIMNKLSRRLDEVRPTFWFAPDVDRTTPR
jgi:hypothetical protein